MFAQKNGPARCPVLDGRPSKRKKGFTLVELLVVIAIISILAALLLPTLKSALDSAREASCANQFKQLSLAANMYADENSNWLPTAGSGTLWREALFPYVDSSTSYSTSATVKEGNVYRCPCMPEEMFDVHSSACGTGWNHQYLGLRKWIDLDNTSLPESAKRSQLPTRRTKVTNPSKTIELGDTRDGSDFDSHQAIYMYVPGQQVGPSDRHRDGGNYAHLDCHAAWYSRDFLIEDNKWLYWRNKNSADGW